MITSAAKWNRCGSGSPRDSEYRTDVVFRILATDTHVVQIFTVRHYAHSYPGSEANGYVGMLWLIHIETEIEMELTRNTRKASNRWDLSPS